MRRRIRRKRGVNTRKRIQSLGILWLWNLLAVRFLEIPCHSLPFQLSGDLCKVYRESAFPLDSWRQFPYSRTATSGRQLHDTKRPQTYATMSIEDHPYFIFPKRPFIMYRLLSGLQIWQIFCKQLLRRTLIGWSVCFQQWRYILIRLPGSTKLLLDSNDKGSLGIKAKCAKSLGDNCITERSFSILFASSNTVTKVSLQTIYILMNRGIIPRPHLIKRFNTLPGKLTQGEVWVPQGANHGLILVPQCIKLHNKINFGHGRTLRYPELLKSHVLSCLTTSTSIRLGGMDPRAFVDTRKAPFIVDETLNTFSLWNDGRGCPRIRISCIWLFVVTPILDATRWSRKNRDRTFLPRGILEIPPTRVLPYTAIACTRPWLTLT